MDIFVIRNDMIGPLLKIGLQTFPSVLIGKSLEFESPSRISPQCTLINSSIGAYSYLNDRAELNNVVIGRYCSIAKGVMIGAGDHPLTWITSSPALYDQKIFGWRTASISDLKQHAMAPVQIGHDVWIGTNVVVKQGIIIGQGAVIGANAVVTRDVDPNAIVGGVPATVIRKRFSEDVIGRLMSLRWYDYDLPNWNVHREGLSLADINHFTLDKIQLSMEKNEVPLLNEKKYKIWFNGDGICVSLI